MGEEIIIQNARMASIAREYFDKIIDKKREQIYAGMKNICRYGEHDVVKYASAVSALICLEDLQEEIKRQINAANQIEKGVINNEHIGR